ncbi:MAG TPA: HAD family hydrolase [Thermoplasmata archaeon]|nr:HAD family hydrolase [Thermoplasmata archaeon]
MIRGVTFDWWHTIAETPWPDFDAHMRRIRVERIAQAFADRGLVVEIDVLYRAYDRHTDLLAENWTRNVDLSGEEQIRAFLEFADLDGSDPYLGDALAASFGEAIRTKLPILYPHVGATLAALKREGYRIGLVSNTGRTWGRFLRPIQDDLGVGKFFDDRVFSDEIGIRKPEPQIFEAALEHLGLRPEQVVHVGDDVLADVTGSKGVGMRAVWFNTGTPAEHAVHTWAGRPSATPDAEIHEHRDLLAVLERWRP